MKILITGFEPFGGDRINPSLEAVKKLPKKIGECEVISASLPVVFGKSLKELFSLIQKEQPDICICVGQAGGRKDITPERVAINVDDARIADNEGNTPVDEPVFPEGENACFSTLPIKAIVKKLSDAGIPSSVSNTAGTYVCNHVMYGLLHYIQKEQLSIRGGFVHIPCIPSQVKERPEIPSMELKDIIKGLVLVIEATLENLSDIRVSGGTVC